MKDRSRIVSNLQRHRKRWLTLILLVYTLLAVGYGVVTPLFEAPDEHHHFFTTKVIALTRRLPTTFDDTVDLTGQEAAQPPLYYILASVLSAPFGENRAFEALWPNPFVLLGNSDSPQNINAFIHGPDEAWPWQGFALEAHLLRFFSTLIGLGTLLCVYAAASLLWPVAAERALLATALTAFLPQFVFLHSAITNDVLIIFLCTAALWQLLRLWYRGHSWGRLLLLGGTIGLAVLTKMAGLLLLAYALGFLMIFNFHEKRQQKTWEVIRKWLFSAGLVTAITLLLSGWLLWRNWQLYDDITATNQILSFFGGNRQYTLLEVFGESSGLWASLFAVFGWFNVVPPGWVYLLWNGLVVAALIGFLIEIGRRWRSNTSPGSTQQKAMHFLHHPSGILDWPGLPGLLLAIWVLVVYAGLVRFMLQIHAGQGRLLLPALLPLVLGLVYGLTRYRWSGIIVLAPLLALLTTVYCLFFVISPAYTRPPVMAEQDLPATIRRLDASLGQGLDLLGAQVETEEALPGEPIWLTLYWQAETVTESSTGQDAPVLVLELLGRENELVGKFQSYHGGGLYPANLWNVGEVVAERIAVELFEEAAAPILARLNVKLAGEETSVDVGTIKVIPYEWPVFSEDYLAEIEGIQLTTATISPESAAAGDSVAVELDWQVLEPPQRDLTTFIHLGDPTQPPLAQGDSLPLGGDYPTSIWAAGERFSDIYHLVLPADLAPGSYPVYLGFYDPANGLRLPLTAGGQRQPHDAYLVGNLVVTN